MVREAVRNKSSYQQDRLERQIEQAIRQRAKLIGERVWEEQLRQPQPRR